MNKIISLLEKDNSRLYKEGVVINEAENSNDEFFAGAMLSFNALITFGVKQVPTATKDGKGITFAEFKAVADRLAARTLTGHDARDAIEALMNKATVDQWNGWYRRILLKDWRCGVTATTINAAVKQAKKKEYAIPTFDCMLAHDSAKHEKKMVGEKLLDIKLDGNRALAIFDGDSVTLYSRNGKVWENYSHVEEAIMGLGLKEPTVIDGEIVSESFQ